MSDRELLEKAARAAGIKAVYTPMLYLNGLSILDDETGRHTDWNPLQDDGDALRLAVKLNINIQHMSFLSKDAHYIAAGVADWSGMKVRAGDNPCAATRRAIVRAAAAIGSAHEAQ